MVSNRYAFSNYLCKVSKESVIFRLLFWGTCTSFPGLAIDLLPDSLSFKFHNNGLSLACILCDATNFLVHLSDVVELCRACPDLMELDLNDATLLTCHAVLHISKHLQQLEHLALSRCYHISPRTLSCLASLPRLQAVDCFGMLGDNPLQELKEKLQGVQVNSFPFSSIARPTTGLRRTSIWGQRVRESVN